MLTGSSGILTAGLGILTGSPGIGTLPLDASGSLGIDTLPLRCLPGDSVSLPGVPVSILCPSDSYRVTRYRYCAPPMLTGRLGTLTAGLGILTGSPGIDTCPADA